MKTPLLLTLMITATAVTAGPTVEGSLGKTQVSRNQYTPLWPDQVAISSDYNTDVLTVELGGSYPVYSWLDGFGGLTVSGNDPFERVDQVTVYENGIQQHRVQRESRQVGVVAGLDLHTPHDGQGFSVGARLGYNLSQQTLTVRKTLTVNQISTDKTPVGTTVETTGRQLISAPVIGVYAEYQYDTNNSVRLFVNQSSADFDDEAVIPFAAQGARLEQDMRTVGLMFRHRY